MMAKKSDVVKKSAKKAVAKLEPEVVPVEPSPLVPRVQRVLADKVGEVNGLVEAGWDAFAVDNGWVYLKK